MIEGWYIKTWVPDKLKHRFLICQNVGSSESTMGQSMGVKRSCFAIWIHDFSPKGLEDMAQISL